MSKCLIDLEYLDGYFSTVVKEDLKKVKQDKIRKVLDEYNVTSIADLNCCQAAIDKVNNYQIAEDIIKILLFSSNDVLLINFAPILLKYGITSIYDNISNPDEHYIKYYKEHKADWREYLNILIEVNFVV